MFEEQILSWHQLQELISLLEFRKDDAYVLLCRFPQKYGISAEQIIEFVDKISNTKRRDEIWLSILKNPTK